jgi:hypothetical protein
LIQKIKQNNAVPILSTKNKEETLAIIKILRKTKKRKMDS